LTPLALFISNHYILNSLTTAMLSQTIIENLTDSALGGVSKTQLCSHLVKHFGLEKKEAVNLLNSFGFAKKPKFINYFKHYNINLPREATQIYFPCTKIYEYKNFLAPEECNELMEVADQKVRRSCVANPNDEAITSDYRTSWTADLEWQHSNFINQIDIKIGRALNLNPFLGEMVQVQRYNPGQYYKEHCDFFHPGTKEYKVYTEWMGQRTWTFMVYLNDVEEGGETYFKYLNLKIKPEQGKAILWSNLYPFGLPNPKTMHEALPPISGDKYVITKWWRSWSLMP
jgi:prolyl 4-hydroxylase